MKCYKCDRCHKTFETQKYKSGDLYLCVYDEKSPDLCDECRTSLTEWFSNKEK